MIEIFKGSYNVVLLGMFLFFALLHRKKSSEERKKEVMKIVILVAVWSAFLVYVNIGSGPRLSTAAPAADTSRTFLSQIPRI